MFRYSFYTFTKAIEELSRRKKAASNIQGRKDVMEELARVNSIILEKGDQKTFGLSYSEICSNYKRMLEEKLELL